MKAMLSALFAGLLLISTASAFAATGNILVADDTAAQPSDQGSSSDQNSGDQKKE